MKCCEGCFRDHADPLRALTREASSLGNCDLCGCPGTDVWDATALVDQFFALTAHYEAVDDGSAPSLAVALQNDWSIFSVAAEPRVAEFLDAVFQDESAHIPPNRPARLRRDGEVEGDQVDAWARFASDLMFGNRYFPAAADNLEFIENVVLSRVRKVEAGVVFFRARVCDTKEGFPGDRMSMPPAAYASAGRANPVGIPHLYLAQDLETCIRECRAVQHNFVTALGFETREPIRVLRLDDFRPLNPFGIEDSAASRLDAARTVERLGRELQRPVRPTDNEVEYVPTQYLSGLVRNLGLDGILYSSSLHPGGTNAVLFSDEKVLQHGDPRTYEITSMTLERQLV